MIQVQNTHFRYLQLAELTFETFFGDKEEGGEHRGTNPNGHLHELPFYGDASHLISEIQGWKYSHHSWMGVAWSPYEIEN